LYQPTNQPTAQPCEIQDRFGLSLSRVTDWLAPTIGSGVSCRAPLYAAPPWTYGPSSTDSAAEEETSMNQTRPRAPGLGSLIIASFPTSGLHYRALSGSLGALASGRVGRGRPGCRSIERSSGRARPNMATPKVRGDGPGRNERRRRGMSWALDGWIHICRASVVPFFSLSHSSSSTKGSERESVELFVS
jgi:hypothetical protein